MAKPNKNFPHGSLPRSGVPADHKPAQRTCLGHECGKVFASAGPGVRLCPKCRLRASSRSGSRPAGQ
jgi:hypothetical protein